MNTKDVGDITEVIIIAEFIKRGKKILIPFGDNSRYDFVIDDGGEFIRIQCKTGKLKNGVIGFSTCNTSYHRRHKNYRRSYTGQIEFFGVYCPDNEKIYVVPVEDVGIREGSLRILHPKNNQKKGIRYAEMYELK